MARYVSGVIATVVFILAFVLIAVSVFFVAMSGGAKGSRDSLQAQGRGTGRAVMIGIFAVIIAGIVAIPGYVMVHNATTQSHQAPGGIKLTVAQQHGREMFASNCAQCHTLKSANAVGKVGINMDKVRPPAALVLNAINIGRARGMGSMPAQLLVGADAKDVASFVAATAGRDPGSNTATASSSSAAAPAPAAAAPAAAKTPAAPAEKTATSGSAAPKVAAIDAKALFVNGAGSATACGACHTLAAAGTNGQTGPNLNKFIEAGDTKAAIKDMIVNPNSEIAKGYAKGIMPLDYGKTLSAAQIDALVDYIYKDTHPGP